MATISNVLVIFPLLYQNIWYKLKKKKRRVFLFVWGSRFLKVSVCDVTARLCDCGLGPAWYTMKKHIAGKTPSVYGFQEVKGQDPNTFFKDSLKYFH